MNDPSTVIGSTGSSAAAAVVPCSVTSRAGPESWVRLKAVKYAELARAVRAGRGKVVVVEVWAEY